MITYLSPEQVMVQEAVRTLLDRAPEAESGSNAGASERWRALAENGFLFVTDEDAMRFDEVAVLNALVMEQLGYSLASEPFLSTAVHALSLLDASSSWGGAAQLRQSIAAGQEQVLVSCSLRHWPSAGLCDLSAKPVVGGKLLVDGTTEWSCPISTIDLLFVPAILQKVECGEAIVWFCVRPGAPGLQIETRTTFDGRQAARASFKGLIVPDHDIMVTGGKGAAALARMQAMQIVMLGAEALGSAKRAHEATVSYCGTREQFGRALNAFQVVQHRLVDMAISLDRATSALLAGLSAVSSPDPDRDSKLATSAFNMVEAVNHVVNMAVHQHGGIGVTAECVAGQCYNRVTAVVEQLGHSYRFLDVLGNRLTRPIRVSGH